MSQIKRAVDWALGKVGLERKTGELAKALSKIEAYQQYVERIGRAASKAGVKVLFDKEVLAGVPGEQLHDDVYVVGRHSIVCGVVLHDATIFISPGASPFYAQGIISFGPSRPVETEHSVDLDPHHICDVRMINCNWDGTEEGMKPFVNLYLDSYSQSMARDSRHAEEVMKDLGIHYEYSRGSAALNGWIFWNCENVPDELPNWLKVRDGTTMDDVGHWLTKELAAELTKSANARLEMILSIGQRERS